jgi:Holliday junction resolvase RusA-like endonuclease
VRECASVSLAEQHGLAWNAHAQAYGVRMFFFKASARRADFDNLSKSITDALSKLLYPDDSCITRAYVEVAIDRENPRAEVEVEVLR